MRPRYSLSSEYTNWTLKDPEDSKSSAASTDIRPSARIDWSHSGFLAPSSERLEHDEKVSTIGPLLQLPQFSNFVELKSVRLLLFRATIIELM